MLFKLRDKFGYKNLCILSISPDVLDEPGVFIANCNAASDYAIFRLAPNGLDIVDEELVFAKYWTHVDYAEYCRRVSIKCAEVLVPDCVDAKFISSANVSCTESKIQLEDIMRNGGANINVVVDRELFFG